MLVQRAGEGAGKMGKQKGGEFVLLLHSCIKNLFPESTHTLIMFDNLRRDIIQIKKKTEPT